MTRHDEGELLSWTISGNQIDLTVTGSWTLARYDAIQACIRRFRDECAQADIRSVHAGGIAALDTVGAERLLHLLGDRHADLIAAEQAALSPERRAMVKAVAHAMKTLDTVPDVAHRSLVTEILGNIGQATVRFWNLFLGLLAFSGVTLDALFRNLLRPGRWRVTSIVAQIEETGLDAVPIVALLTFLVGAVIAFLGATILADFGATTYTINLVGFSFLREFAVLLTAILLAGRTASAFTAQIGSMKVNEEIDAIRVQGLDPVELLVLPRVLAMQVSLPILTFVGMISGIAGGMLVCAVSLDISPQVFLDTFAEDVPVRHFVLGMAKAPVFAFLIAVIGCLEGFKVQGSAQSVGEHTTAAVVHSIFVVILLDALAALFFMEMGW
ncbi:MAG TPA: ABC transporter permease [Burkholderiaceae bacterium]|nr:ABC transporter permease [Burkholderiaceae bacterium]